MNKDDNCHQVFAAGTAVRFEPGQSRAVRFEPGQSREVRLVPYGGLRRVFGFNGKVMGDL